MFVVVEGIDGAGKGTVVRHVDKALTALKLSTAAVGFPMYAGTTYGRLIGRYLNGEFGEMSHPYLHGTLYAVDRLEARGYLRDLIAHRDVVISDRYVSSNLCYSAVKAKPELRDEVARHFSMFEFFTLEASKPDLHVFLDMPVEFAVKNIAKKEKRVYTDRPEDILEADHAFLSDVRKFYVEELNRYLPESVRTEVVECVQDGVLRSVEDISAEVVRLILDARNTRLS
jgi:dTMP kinase